MVVSPPVVPAGTDQRLVMHGVPWAHYEAQMALRGEKRVPRVFYLEGAMELTSPSEDHEKLRFYIGRLLEVYALKSGIDFSGYGSWTLKSGPKEAGAEPDECYIVGLDQDKNVPDLVIEVVWTSGGLDKLEIYRRLGVREVWFWIERKIQVYVLGAAGYKRVTGSSLFPGLDIELLTKFLDQPVASRAIRAYRDALRKKPAGKARARK